MTMQQIITPNPNIWCRPGWCLEYVNNAFQVPERFGSATDAWYGSASQHRDRDFPAGVWVPVWYGIVQEPLGHVVLRAPDGSVYSTSDLTNTPRHHPDLADLERYYAKYGLTLVYRGWTEDVEGTPVIATGGISYEGSIAEAKDTFMPDLSEEEQRRILAWADRGNAVVPDEHAQILTTKHVADLVKQVWDISIPLPDGKNTTTPGRKVTYQKQEFNVIGAKIDALAAAVATMVSAQPGVTISSDEILGQIDNTLRDVLAKGAAE
jgi:hypothetical protein